MKPFLKRDEWPLVWLYFFIKVGIIIVAGIAFWFVVNPFFLESMYTYRAPSSFIDHFVFWDGQWYLHLAEEGYSFGDSGTYLSDHGFYPLYPFLIFVLEFFFLPFAFSGLLISFLAGFVAVIFLYRLINEDYGHAVAHKSVLYLLLFPAAFFLSAGYTEALFLMLAVLCFVFARQQRWFLVGVCGFLISLTRIQGIFIFFPLAFMYLKQKQFKLMKIKWNALYLFLIPLGVFLFYLFLWAFTGDFFASYHDQAHYWGKHLEFPWTALFSGFLADPQFHSYFSSGIDVFFGVFFFILLFSIWNRLPREYFIYALCMWAVPLIGGGNSQSLTRYLLLSFPSFIVLGQMGKRNKIVHYVIVTAFASLLVYFTFLFVRGYWVG